MSLPGDEHATEPDRAIDDQPEADGDELVERLDDDEGDLWSPGLPDTAFVRAGACLAPSEVRVLALARAHLFPSARVLNIGAGCGGFAVEAALLCSEGEVVAFERDQEALSVLRLNVGRFDLDSVRIVESRSPDGLRALGSFDRVLISGDNRLPEVLEALPSLLKPEGRAVAITETVESTGRVISVLRSWPWEGFDAVQMSIARAVQAGSMLRLEALDPVWIIAADVTKGERPARQQRVQAVEDSE